MNIKLWESVYRSVDHNNVEAAITQLERILGDSQQIRFTGLIGKDFSNAPQATLAAINEFIADCNKSFEVKAVFLGMNGFDVNPDRWYFDFFAYPTYSDDPDDVDWLSQSSSPDWPSVTLTGLEKVQDDFRWYFKEQVQKTNNALEPIHEAALLLVLCKYILHIKRALQTGPSSPRSPSSPPPTTSTSSQILNPAIETAMVRRYSTSNLQTETVNPDIFCPECGYNLRGIAERRCPECGYGFDHQAIKTLARAQGHRTVTHARNCILMSIAATACVVAAYMESMGITWKFRAAATFGALAVTAWAWHALADVRPPLLFRTFNLLMLAFMFTLGSALLVATIPRAGSAMASGCILYAWVRFVTRAPTQPFSPRALNPPERRIVRRHRTAATLSLVTATLLVILTW